MHRPQHTPVSINGVGLQRKASLMASIAVPISPTILSSRVSVVGPLLHHNINRLIPGYTNTIIENHSTTNTTHRMSSILAPLSPLLFMMATMARKIPRPMGIFEAPFSSSAECCGWPHPNKKNVTTSTQSIQAGVVHESVARAQPSPYLTLSSTRDPQP